MWDKIIQAATDNGLWAMLFCALLVFELKDSRAREAKYQGTIAKLSQDLGYMNSIDRRIEKIHSRMREYMESNTVCETAKEEA